MPCPKERTFARLYSPFFTQGFPQTNHCVLIHCRNPEIRGENYKKKLYDNALLGKPVVIGSMCWAAIKEQDAGKGRRTDETGNDERSKGRVRDQILIRE